MKQTDEDRMMTEGEVVRMNEQARRRIWEQGQPERHQPPYRVGSKGLRHTFGRRLHRLKTDAWITTTGTHDKTWASLREVDRQRWSRVGFDFAWPVALAGFALGVALMLCNTKGGSVLPSTKVTGSTRKTFMLPVGYIGGMAETEEKSAYG